jgi:predicted NAD/FAD-binding protein
MRIAVIGSGISGMTAAYRLNASHDVTVYEAGASAGGHTNTVDVEYRGAAAAMAAQARRREINGTRRTYYCGAYWGYGFHEDGVKSALVSVEELRRRHDYEQPNLQRVG